MAAVAEHTGNPETSIGGRIRIFRGGNGHTYIRAWCQLRAGWKNVYTFLSLFQSIVGIHFLDRALSSRGSSGLSQTVLLTSTTICPVTGGKGEKWEAGHVFLQSRHSR